MGDVVGDYGSVQDRNAERYDPKQRRSEPHSLVRPYVTRSPREHHHLTLVSDRPRSLDAQLSVPRGPGRCSVARAR